MTRRSRRENTGGVGRKGNDSAWARVRAFVGSLPVALLLAIAAPAEAQRVWELSLEDAVAMAMNDSYQIRRVRLEVDRTRQLLEAEQAGLRSSVSLEFALPEFERISEQRWNSTLQRNEIVRENTRRWQMEFSIEQPVILFGYPTNGYLSANNRVYRYMQIDGDERDLSYYNRYFLRYRQPLFQPNELKNDLEDAELDLEAAELDYFDDAISIIENIGEDYYELFELAYEEIIYSQLVGNLESALEAANERFAEDPVREIEVNQVQVTLSNAQAELQQARSDFRLEASRVKPNLGLGVNDSIVIRPVIELRPVSVDQSRAVELGLTLRPQIRSLQIERRQDELELADVSGENSFQLDLELTYGREMEDTQFGQLLQDPSNSYTLGVRGRVPIWDWGERSSRIEAQRLALQQRDLSIEETREEIEIQILNTIQNLTEYQDRAENMRQNLALAEGISSTSLAQYREGAITVLDLVQSFERQQDTATNFLDAYMGYRSAILDLQQMTYYDFENDVPVLQRFGIAVETNERTAK